MPNQFFSEEFGDLEDYFLTDYELMERYIGDNLYVWGQNDNGQLGVNNSENRDTPLTIFNNTRNWKECSLSSGSGIGIKNDGTLWNWGGNRNILPFPYVLGINQGTTSGRSTPVTTILGGNNWKSIAKLAPTQQGSAHGAIKTDGTLWLWGSNFRGSLGVNDTTTRSTPVTTILGGTNWKSVACGDAHTVALKTDGTLWTWGRAQNGTLGTNDTIDRSTPVTTLLGGNDWKSVSGLEDGAVAIKTDGTLWVWGLNNAGQLGVNDTTSRSTPVTTLLGGNDWKFADGGNWHTAAIKTDGTLWCWGYIINGQIGINTSFNGGIYTPVTTFLGGNDWKTCAAGERNTAAIKTDGTLWIWGASGGFGGLGIGDEDIDNVDRLTPITTVLGGNNWKSISLGYHNSAAIQLGASIDATPPTEVLFDVTTNPVAVWVVPDGVTSVSVVCIGGGGGGNRDTGGCNGSGGGGLAWRNNISVTPGQRCPFRVGQSGRPAWEGGALGGGSSWFISTSTCWANGGSVGTLPGGTDLVGAGGTFIGDGGGNGGNGGSRNGSSAGSGGGGGAGGYEGNGGNGGGFFANAAAGAGFTGSGGGGGGGGCGGSADTAGAGGGVSPYGIGLSGFGGAGSGADGHGGFGGSAVRTSNSAIRQKQYDAVNANVVNQAANTYSDTVTADAGPYGGGAGGSDIVTSDQQGRGGGGCVRIVWTPGYTFP